MKEFTKDDLTNRMVVETRQGNRYLVIDDLLLNSNGESFTGLFHYTDNLKLLFTNYSDYDIMKVYETVTTLDDIKNTTDLLWNEKNSRIQCGLNQPIQNLVIKFYDLKNGNIVALSDGTPVAEMPCEWIPHTNKSKWVQVDEPSNEMTIEEIQNLLGYKIKIVKNK